jgi:hypothetical protein
MKRAVLAVAGILMCVSLVGFSVPAEAGKVNVTIKNKSDWEIHHFFLSPVEQEEWGPDQLGDEVIDANGGSFLLHSIPCASYDIKLIDEDGDECVVADVDICGNNQAWTITSDDLLECEGESEE